MRSGVCVHVCVCMQAQSGTMEMVGPCSQLDIWEDFLEKELLKINSKG